MVMRYRAALPALGLGVAAGALLLAGCGSTGSGGGSNALGAANPGQVTIQLADAPVTGVQAVNVTFTKMEGLYDGEADSKAVEGDKESDSGDDKASEDSSDQWVTLSTKAVTVDLLAYANKPVSGLFDLIDAGVPSGHYKKFRFTIGAVDVVINGSHVTPTLVSSTVEVRSQCFVNPQKHKVLVLDFDVAESLQGSGTSYTFDPKLRLRPMDQSSPVMGTVQFQATTATSSFEAQVQLTDASGQMVGESEVEVEPSAAQTTAQADFVVHAVPPGTYSLVVVGDDAFQGATSTPIQVQVVAGQPTQAGTVTLSH